MKNMTPAMYAEKLIRNLSAAQTDMVSGVQSVTESPTAAAAAKATEWQAAMAQAKTRERFEAGLNRVTLSDWKKAMIEKGIPRVATGIAAARPKIERFATQFLPVAAEISAECKAMPGVTLADGKARCMHAIDRAAAFKMT